MKQTSRMLIVSVTVFALFALAGCDPMRSATATERALCEAWADALFDPSRQDTQATVEGLTAARKELEAACPGYTVEPAP